jgi:filamentous hemagglutinin
MEEKGDFLYRGTSRGWPGNPRLQALGRTYASSDPLVATLFAIECLRHGEGIVQMAHRDPLEPLIGAPNFFDDVECAINLMMTPAEFTQRVAFTLHAHKAREILAELGFNRIPYLINDKEALNDALEQTHRHGERCRREQIQEFDRRALEVGS